MSYRETIGFVGGENWTPSDTDTITRKTRGFQVAVEGDVALEYKDGTTQVWPACIAGVSHAHSDFVKVLDTGTTATGIVIGY